MNALIDATGAVVMGKRTFEMGDPDSFVGNYEFQVPIFVATNHPPTTPPKRDEHLTFTFVSDGVASAIDQAKTAAGDKAVQVVGGASVINQLLRANLVDVLHVDVMPVLLGAGLRLLDDPALPTNSSTSSRCSRSAHEPASAFEPRSNRLQLERVQLLAQLVRAEHSLVLRDQLALAVDDEHPRLARQAPLADRRDRLELVGLV